MQPCLSGIQQTVPQPLGCLMSGCSLSRQHQCTFTFDSQQNPPPTIEVKRTLLCRQAGKARAAGSLAPVRLATTGCDAPNMLPTRIVACHACHHDTTTCRHMPPHAATFRTHQQNTQSQGRQAGRQAGSKDLPVCSCYVQPQRYLSHADE